MLVIALQLLEGEDLSASLRVLNVDVLGELAASMNFIQKEVDYLRLVDVAMVGINLNQGLNQVLGGL